MPKSPSYCGNSYKLDELSTCLIHQHKFDFIGISETWLNGAELTQDLDINHYNFYHRDRSTLGGGVGAYVTTNLVSERRPELEHNDLEIIWIELKLKPRSIIVGVCYRPPGQSRQQADNFIQNLETSIQSIMSKNYESVVLVGDFNDRCTSWSGDHRNSELRLQLHDLVNTFNLMQLINEPTYITTTSANILDLIITDSPGYISDSGVLPPIGSSNHAIPYCKLKKYIPSNSVFTKDLWDFNRGDYTGLRLAIEDLPLNELVHSSEDIDTIVDRWTTLILDTAKEFIPFKSVKIHSRDKPWMTSEVRHFLKQRDRLYKRYKSTRLQNHLDTYNRAKYDTRKAIENAKNKHMKNFIVKLQSSSTNPRQFWSLSKELYGNIDRQ